jgi:alpha-D-xyloside xylohydrolase
MMLLFVFLNSSVTQASIRLFKKEKDGVLFSLDKGCMKIRVCRDDIIQVKYTMFNTFPAQGSLVVNNEFNQRVLFDVSQSKESIIIKTRKLIISINRASNAITYSTLSGQTITSEADNNKTMQPQTVAGIATYSCATTFNSPADEALFGLGCHPLDSKSINYKGRDQDMAIKYLTGAIPVLLSTKGYGLFWDNYSASNFYGSEDGNTKFKYVSESGKQVNYYFFYGPDFDHIIDLYRTATGKAPMFPKWSFGLFQSQDR